MPDTASPDAVQDPFSAGPFRWLRERLPRGRTSRQRVCLHSVITIAVLWVPLVILAAWEGLAVSDNAREAFLYDISTYLIGGQVAVVLLLFAGPLVLLSRKMFDLKARATFQYGWLASELGRQFELRWLASNQKPTAEALAASDFSATTDLYSIAANVQGINLLVIDLRTVMMLALATLLPYVPLVFVLMPFEEVVRLAIKTVL